MGRRTARRIGWAVLLAAPPAVLAWWEGWPLPTSWPTSEEVDRWLARPLTADTAAVVGWLVWAILGYATLARSRSRRLRQAARTAESVGGAMLLLVGVPIGLVWWAGWPLPASWPSQTQIHGWLAEPLTWPTIVAAIALVGWMFWAVLLYAVVVEVVTRLRRLVRWLPRPPVPTPLQGLVGGLFGAAALAMNTPTAASGVAVDTGAATAAEQPMPDVGTQQVGPVASESARSSTGVDLPDGGWLPDAFAEVIAGAATFTWWLRRHHYEPGPPAGQIRSDPDLAPLPPTIAAVQAARQAAAEAGRTEDAGGAGLVVIGQHGSRPLHAEGLPEGGIGLIGPGSLDAARGVLATHLLAPPTPDRTPRLVTTRADVERLLGHTGAGLPPTVRVVDDELAAVSVLEHVLLDRARITQHLGAAGAGLPSLVLLTAAPDQTDVRSRLAVLLTLGHRFHVAGVLLGDWPDGSTWRVDRAGGVFTSPGGPVIRLGVLPAAAVEDLVTLASSAAGRVRAAAVAEPAVTTDLTIAPAAAAGARPATVRSGRPVRLTLLGAVSVHINHQPVEIGRSAGLQILALLALQPAGLTSRQLTELIWPNLRPHLASGRFHTTISDLRRTLHTRTGGLDVVERAGGRYRLDSTNVDADVWQLRSSIDAAATFAAADHDETALRAVVDTYRGELAAGQQWPWLPPYRESLRRAVIDAYTALAAARPDQAVYLRLAATRIDPLNAYLHRHAIQALTEAGDHTAALALTQAHTRHLSAAGLAPQPDAGASVDGP